MNEVKGYYLHRLHPILLPSLLSRLSFPVTLTPPLTPVRTLPFSFYSSLSPSFCSIASSPCSSPSPFPSLSCNHDYQATVNWQSDKFEVPTTTVKTLKASPSTLGHLDDNAIKAAKHAEHAKDKYANLTSKLYAPTHVRSLIFLDFVWSSV